MHIVIYVGPLIIVSVTSLVINIALIGGAKQLSRKIVLMWLVWEYIMILLFWLWYGYNMMKFHGYIDWTDYGMRQCYWCSQKNIQASCDVRIPRIKINRLCIWK